MSRRLSTALLFTTALALLPAGAHAGVKSGAAPVHPIVAPNIHPVHPHAGIHSETHRKFLQAMHKFPHHHHRRAFGWGLPYTPDGFYGSYYDPADQPGEVDPALFSDPYSGPPRARAFYRTGCLSEEVSVPGSHGPTRVTVTRCSVPIPEPQPPK